jgi:uncharacterized RDD family membrane protein YckC
MYCTKCGTPVQEGASFCRVCGQPIAVVQTTASETATTPASPDVVAPADAALPPVPPIQPPWPAATVPPMSPSSPVTAEFESAYAGFWFRVVAYLIDSAVLGVAFGAVVAIIIATMGIGAFRGLMSGLYDRGPNALLPAAALGMLFILVPATIVGTWLYFALMEASVHQATLGKMALGLFVTDLQGHRVSFGRATGRFFAKLVTGLVPLFIGYIMAGFTAKRQALHDMIAGCLVMKKV